MQEVRGFPLAVTSTLDTSLPLTTVSPLPAPVAGGLSSSNGCFDISLGLSSDGDDDNMLTLRQRVEKNVGIIPFPTLFDESQDFTDKQMFPYPHHAEKPPTGRPKKGLNVKSTKKKKRVAVPADALPLTKNGGTVDNSRFHAASDSELEQLQMDAKAAWMHSQTKWGINLLLGIIHNIFTHIHPPLHAYFLYNRDS